MKDRTQYTPEEEARRHAIRHWKVASAVVAGALLTATAFAVLGGDDDATRDAFAGCSTTVASAGAQPRVGDSGGVGESAGQRARPGTVYLCRETSLLASLR